MNAPRSATNIVLFFLFVATPVCVGIFFIGKGLIEHPIPWESIGWSKTEGTIVGWTVTHRGRTFGQETSGRRSWFDADISYQYDVNGNIYAGEDARFMLDNYRQEQLDQVEAEARAGERFPVGARVEVSYNPLDPAQSTLQPGWKSTALVDFAMGLTCICIAIWLGWPRRQSTAV